MAALAARGCRVADRTDRAAPTGRQAILAVSARRGEIGVALALLAVGLFFAAASFVLDFGSFALPGPGFFPCVLGVLLAGFSVALAARARREQRDGEPVPLGHRDVIIGLAALLAVAIAFEPLGAFLTLGLFAAALLVLIGRVSPPRAALSAAIGMAALWYFFKVLLGLQLPVGLLRLGAMLGLLTAGIVT
jgi:hypothetical protein